MGVVNVRYGLINMSRVLRVDDNPLVGECLKDGRTPIPFYPFDDSYFIAPQKLTGIPRMMGTRFNWLYECLIACKELLVGNGLDLIPLVGQVTQGVRSLLRELRGYDPGVDIQVYTLACPDRYDVHLRHELESVCNAEGLRLKVVTGYSTCVSIPCIFAELGHIPTYRNQFMDVVLSSLSDKKGFVIPHTYTLKPWDERLRLCLTSLSLKGVEDLEALEVVHKGVNSVRDTVLGLGCGKNLEAKAWECVEGLLDGGGILSYDPSRLQGSSMLSPFIANGVIAPYTLFNEVLYRWKDLYGKRECETLRAKYLEFLNRLLSGVFAVCIGLIEQDGVDTLSSRIRGTRFEATDYLGIETSKTLINEMMFGAGVGDAASTSAVSGFIKILMNRGFVSNRVRLAISLCLINSKVNPLVVRDLFQAFLIDYTSYGTYVGLLWCLGGGSSNLDVPSPISITKQIVSKEMGLLSDNTMCVPLPKGKERYIDYLSLDFIKGGTRLPVRCL